MSDTILPHLLKKSGSEILEEWDRQLNSAGRRSDLIKASEERAQGQQFLTHLETAAKEGSLANLKAPEWKPVLDFLSEISKDRGRLGFSPSETALFVLSLKQPINAALREEVGKDSDELFKEITAVTHLLDRLALHTVEMHQRAREEVIVRQQMEMIELSTPVVKLWDGIVALPLIGTLDSARTNVVMESLLQQIVSTGAEIAIIDITGVPTVDTLVAQHLLKTVAAARLMGADCIISGIRPQIAQTMVHLGIDLTAVSTKATMAEALKTAMNKMGFKVTREK
jgi:rsbT co-antagonist protein RsbR